MDYQQELARLRENEENAKSEYWKPKAAQYKVKALSELEEAKPYEEEGKEPQLRKQIHVVVDSKEYTWSMPYGITPASTYGQLINLGAAKGKLTDLEFTVVVTGDAKTKRFTIVM
jgi:hypothetical protein